MGAKQKVILILVTLILALASSTLYYRSKSAAALDRLREAKASAEAVSFLINEIVAQNEKNLKAAKMRQEERDREALTEIDRLTAELAARPFRVRVEACENSSLPRRVKEGAHGDSEGSGSETFGILPPGNSERLGRVIAEMERINAAYASCRNLMIGD